MSDVLKHSAECTPEMHCSLEVWKDHSEDIMKKMQFLYLGQHLCDYTVIVDDQSFCVHRCVLASVSDFFKAMLTGPCLESKLDHVQLKGFSAEVMQILVDFAYSGALKLSTENVLRVLEGASRLQIASAISLCSKYLLRLVTTDTAILYLNIAESFGLTELKESSLGMLAEHLCDILNSEEFLNDISEENMLLLLRRDDLNIQTEEELFRTLVAWVEFNLASLQRPLIEYFQHIRFALMDPEKLIDEISACHFIQKGECQTLLRHALQYQLLPYRQALRQCDQTRVRNVPCLVALGGHYKNDLMTISHKMYVLTCKKAANVDYSAKTIFANERPKIQRLSLVVKRKQSEDVAFHSSDHCKDTFQWKELADAPADFFCSGFAVDQNFLYICGGVGRDGIACSACYRYDPRHNNWIQMSSMKSKRQSFPLVAHNGSLFVFGGGSPVDIEGIVHVPASNCERYSLEKNQWQATRKLPVATKAASACVFDNCIYICGGRTMHGPTATVYRYDVKKDMYESLAPMLIARTGHAMFAEGDGIFVVDRVTLSIEKFVPLANNWTRIVHCTNNFEGIARPVAMQSWVYFVSYGISTTQDTKFRQHSCCRVNVQTKERQIMPSFPSETYGVISVPLCLPRKMLSY